MKTFFFNNQLFGGKLKTNKKDFLALIKIGSNGKRLLYYSACMQHSMPSPLTVLHNGSANFETFGGVAPPPPPHTICYVFYFVS